MDGLECSEVLCSEVLASNRLDAEYYKKANIKFENDIKKLNHEQLQTYVDFIIGPFGSAYDTSNYVDTPGYRYVRGQDVKPFELQDNSARYMSQKDYERLSKYALKEGDILVSVVGTIGNACIIQKKDVPAIFSCKSTAIRVKSISSYYLLCYLNSKQGRALLLRKERGAVQKGLNLEDLKTLLVPKFSKDFCKKIEAMLSDAESCRNNAKVEYQNAMQMLEQEICKGQSKNLRQNISIKSYSESLKSTCRLDAEYYQPKYEFYENQVMNYENGYTKISEEFMLVKEKCKRNKNEYRYVEIGDIDIEKGEAESNTIKTEDLPTNAKIMTSLNDLVVSTVRPNRGAVAILQEDGLLVSAAFTVLRSNGNYPVEILQLLLRTEMYKDWMLKYNVGTSYPTIKDEDVLELPIPIFKNKVVQEVKALISNSSENTKKAKSLTMQAKEAVEIAIEQGECIATKWLETLEN